MPQTIKSAQEEKLQQKPNQNDMSAWRMQIKNGQTASGAGDYQTANFYFKAALSHARRLFMRAADKQFSPRNAVHALIVSQHNIAGNFMKRGMLEEAYTHYLSAFSTLCDWLEASNAPEPMRRACAEKLTDATNAVVNYLNRTNAPQQRIAAIYARAAQHREAKARFAI